jgi:hypothetical protein
MVNIYLVSLEIQPQWSGLITRIASDLIRHAKNCTEYIQLMTPQSSICRPFSKSHKNPSWYNYNTKSFHSQALAFFCLGSARSSLIVSSSLG